MVFTKHWEERRFSRKQKEAIEMSGAITCPQPVMRIRNVSQELWFLLGYSMLVQDFQRGLSAR